MAVMKLVTAIVFLRINTGINAAPMVQERRFSEESLHADEATTQPPTHIQRHMKKRQPTRDKNLIHTDPKPHASAFKTETHLVLLFAFSGNKQTHPSG